MQRTLIDYKWYGFSLAPQSHDWPNMSPHLYCQSLNISDPVRNQLCKAHSLQARIIPPTAAVGSDTRNMFFPYNLFQDIAQLVVGENSISTNWLANHSESSLVSQRFVRDPLLDG